MKARIGGEEIDLAGSGLGEVIADLCDDRAGLAGLFFAGLLGDAAAQQSPIEIIE
jgi:hypothetical protein